uniref:Uncharacterized protein n=1 Tax=Syphacia muris TaxID=451379 RepID=A0A0N5AM93_9BILA
MPKRTQFFVEAPVTAIENGDSVEKKRTDSNPETNKVFTEPMNKDQISKKNLLIGQHMDKCMLSKLFCESK